MNSGCNSFTASAVVLFPLPGSPVIHIAIPDIVISKIQGALHLFDGLTWNAMGVDHRRPDIGMAKQFLNCADIVIGLQKVSGETMAEGM